MGSGVARSFGVGRKALIGPEAARSGRHFANFNKVVRVKHVSEILATRVGMWPGEGSAGAPCRKMSGLLLRSPIAIRHASFTRRRRRAVCGLPVQSSNVTVILRQTIRTPKRSPNARPNTKAHSISHWGLPSRPVPMPRIATLAFSLTLRSESRLAQLKKDFDRLTEGAWCRMGRCPYRPGSDSHLAVGGLEGNANYGDRDSGVTIGGVS